MSTHIDATFYQRFYEYLELKSKSTDAALPPMDETFKRIMEQDPELSSNNKFIMDAFRGSFEVKENPKVCSPESSAFRKESECSHSSFFDLTFIAVEEGF